MEPRTMIEVGLEVVQVVRTALDGLSDWGLSGARPGQYHCDVVADDAAVVTLTNAGFGVVSEESGEHHLDRPVVAVLDPVDGSTNASYRVPWFATSICFLDEAGPCAAIVVNQASGATYQAVREEGATLDGQRLAATAVRDLDHALVGIAGWPPAHLGWEQFRALGAAALDIAAVASGTLDAYIDCSDHGHAPWDYLGALLICQEAGAVVEDAFGQPLVTRDFGVRRTPVAAATRELLDEALAARRGLLPPP